MFSFHGKRENMFQTKVVIQKEEPLLIQENFEPIPETRKEAKQLAKYKYLPGERLQIMLNKQARKSKKKPQSIALKKDDVDRISKSMGRIMDGLLEPA